jgi:hypothetical protein
MSRALVLLSKLPPILLLPSLWLPLSLTACDPLTEGIASAGVASVAVLGRTPIDAGYSAITGKDCSAVRLEQGKTYCRPTEPPPETPPYCTRSLGVVDCWMDPASVNGLAPQVADGPRALTPEQEKNRTRSWPNL